MVPKVHLKSKKCIKFIWCLVKRVFTIQLWKSKNKNSCPTILHIINVINISIWDERLFEFIIFIILVKFLWFFNTWTSSCSIYFMYIYIYKTRNYSHWLFPFLTKKFRESFLIIQASLKKLWAAFKFFAFWSPVSRIKK